MDETFNDNDMGTGNCGISDVYYFQDSERRKSKVLVTLTCLVGLFFTGCGSDYYSSGYSVDGLQLIVQRCEVICSTQGYDFDYEITRRDDQNSYCQCKAFGHPDSACIDIQPAGKVQIR